VKVPVATSLIQRIAVAPKTLKSPEVEIDFQLPDVIQEPMEHRIVLVQVQRVKGKS